MSEKIGWQDRVDWTREPTKAEMEALREHSLKLRERGGAIQISDFPTLDDLRKAEVGQTERRVAAALEWLIAHRHDAPSEERARHLIKALDAA